MTIKRLLRQFSILLLCVAFTQIAFSQTKTITGKISDDKGNPIAGATVTARGAKGGTTTDASGVFKLVAPASAKTLVISSVGFAEQEIAIAGKESFDVSMVPSNQALSDVVVIGYGTARKKDLTGAVSQITSKDFTTGNLAVSPAQLFQGKVPGVLVTLPGGDPNGNVSIRLRGQTSLSGGQTPLIVVDGVPLDDPNQLSNIPAGDIASIDVLKDASASAIYGSRGSNGVIVITLKKGASGRTTVDYNGSISMDKVAKYYDMANTAQWEQGYTKLLTNSGSTPGYIDTAIAGFNHGGNTDWQRALTQTGISNNQNISISGGSNGFSYRGSVNYTDQQGLVINSGKKMLGLRFSAQQKAMNDKLTLQLGVVNTTINRKLTDYNIFYEAYSSPPLFPVKNPDGSYFIYSGFDLQNPVQQQMQETQNGTENLTIINANVDYELLAGLKVGVKGSTSHFNNQIEFYEPIFAGVGNTNEGALATGNNDSKKGDIHINYTKSWGRSNLSAVAVYEYNDFQDRDYATIAQNLLLDNIGAWSLQSAPQQYQHAYSNRDEYQLISYLGRIAYNWDQKYYVTASMREDGSSKFGPDYAHGYFPSVSVAWKISNENFMKNISWLNELKINAGWGITGDQDNISPYSKLELYGPSGSYYNAASGLWLTEYGPTQNGNPNLQWEQRTGQNIGFNFAVLNSRLTGNFNYFDDKSTKVLYNYTIPFPSPGAVVDNILANVGSLTNKGAEFDLNYQIIRTKDFSWTAGGQISSVATKVTSLSGSYSNGVSTYNLSTGSIPGGSAEGRGLSSNPITYIQVGYTPYEFEMPHYLGLNQAGIETYDSAGGSTTNILNATNHYTNPAPKFNYGFNSNFTYKAIGLSFFLRGVSGAKIFDNSRMVLDNLQRFGGNNGTVEALTNGINNAPQASDHWLENASFLRMDNLNLSYTLKAINVFQTIRFYIAANNVFVITKYRGLDPEVRVTSGSSNILQNALSATNVSSNFSQGGSTGTQAYIDAAYSGDGYYPKARSFTLGVNVTFK